MASFRCTGVKVTRVTCGGTFAADSPHAAADLFRSAHGFDPEQVADKAVKGRCNRCERVIFHGEPHHALAAGATPAIPTLHCGACVKAKAAGETLA